MLLRYGRAVGLSCLLSGSFLSPAWAQTAPDAGAILRDVQRATTPAPQPAEQTPQAQPAPKKPEYKGEKVLVKDFRIRATRFPESELKDIVKSYIGQRLTLGELQDAALKISEYYRINGYLARAYIPRQDIKNGVVEIVVLEGKLSKITLDPSSNTRLREDIAVGLVANRMPEGSFLRPDDLQEGVSVLNQTPGISATATVQPGEREGESITALKVTDTPLVSGMARADNGGVRSVGAARVIANAAVNNAFGFGGQAMVTGAKTEHSTYGRLALSAPVGYSGLRFGVNGSALTYKVDHDFSAVKQDGDAYTVGASATYPIFLKPSFSLFANGTYDHKHLMNRVADLNINDKKVDVGQLSLNMTKPDTWFGGGINNAMLGVSYGTLDLSGNPVDQLVDNVSARSDGSFSKLSASAARTQKITGNSQFFLSGSGQWSSRTLDSSEQMSLGGPDGVRAYPVNDASADNAFLGRAELRHTVYEGVQLFEFYDAGWAELHKHTWNGWSGAGQPNSYWLQGVGAGASWTPLPSMLAMFTIAHTVGNNSAWDYTGQSDDGGNREKWRAWAHLSYSF